jgi:hypothetical protein
MPTEFDEEIARRTLAQECRGETLPGQIATAWVLKNRLADGRWGHCFASVCLWSCYDERFGREIFQFSGWSPRDPNYSYSCGLWDNNPTLVRLGVILQGVLENDKDPTQGALFYYAQRIEAPGWAKAMRFCGKFGTQIFLSDKPIPNARAAA